MTKYLSSALLVSTILTSAHAMADDRLFLGFGEIPELSDSFKPTIGYSRKVDAFEVGVFLQAEDRLRRDKESFNADFGQKGLLFSKEKTGRRAMIQGRYFPFENHFFLSMAVIYVDEDREKIEFDSRIRTFGQNTYNSSLTVQLDREQDLAPAIGLGMTLPLTERLSFTTGFTMAWFGEMPDVDVDISASADVLPSDLASLERKIKRNYRSNFHNRSHLFNIGMQYSF